jgi:hypothetical protein
MATEKQKWKYGKPTPAQYASKASLPHSNFLIEVVKQ